MLMLPGANITFRACCPSGNNYLSTVTNWNNTANLHYSVLTQDGLKGPTGIWYESKTLLLILRTLNSLQFTRDAKVVSSNLT